MELDDRGPPWRPSARPPSTPLPAAVPRPSYRPNPLPPPEAPRVPRTRLVALAVGAAVLVGAYLLWKRGSPDLDYARVGPRPSVGRQVVVLLHGYGAPGDDLVGLAKEVAVTLPDATFLVPEGPHSVGFQSRAWIPDYSAANRVEYGKRLVVELAATTKKVWEVIDVARKKGALCKDIYVGGFSQGGRMAAEVVLRAPLDCPLGGLILMSPGSMDEAELPPATGKPRLRVLSTHGTQDRVVAMEKGVTLARYFADGGHDVRWLSFEGPHTIPPAVRLAIPAFLRGEAVGGELPPDPLQ